MEQIARIEHMERQLEVAERAVKRLKEAMEEYEAAQEALRDLESDEAGLLPKDLKRGVLSEDAIWNVLEEWRELRIEN